MEVKENSEPISILVENLDTPWALAFLQSGELLVTERNGRISMINDDNIIQIAKITDSKELGEGGLMGLAIHPNYRANNYIYLYYTYSSEENDTLNKVVRYSLQNNSLAEEKIIVDKIPGAIFHNGGRIKFGPDGLLYITTGDSREPSLSQNTNSLAGKILRVTDEGIIPANNPFGNEVYSYGHRNPQGITWDDKGTLYSSEHGRSGIQSGLDELNLIKRGDNYGWPDSQGNEVQAGTVSPLLHSGPDVTWAPGGIQYLDEKLYFVGLKGSTLYEYDIPSGVLNEHFVNEYGRLRDIILGPDNMLYITTSNRDSRGDVRAGDDKIIRINPNSL